MERADRPTVATFVAAGPLVAGAPLTLDEDAAHHMRVRRLEPGAPLALRDGRGGVADGTLVKLARSHAVVELGPVSVVAPPPAVHLLVPVADRERMLWLAEKSVELGAASWRAVLWHRSRSVSPRGEGPAFQQKVRARMAAALAQCEGAWLPELLADGTPERAAVDAPAGARLLLDPDGAPLASMSLSAPLTIAVGPEGGVERAETEQLLAAGFVRAALPGHVLRFETAGVAGLALAHAALAAVPGRPLATLTPARDV